MFENISLSTFDVFIMKLCTLLFFYYYFEKLNKKTNNNDKMEFITWDYLTGLIETDGTFKISLDKKGKYKPIVSISQKENTGLLNKIKDFLHFYKINSTLDISDPKKSNRAPQLRIQGSLQILRFYKLLETNVKGLPFCSQKYRDFLIIKTALSNLEVEVSHKIDLMLSLHKISSTQPDISVYRTKTSRSKHEKRLGLIVNSSKGSADFLLKKIDKDFNDHINKIENSIVNKIKLFNNDWCVGIMDGDGCFSISIEFIKASNKNKINFVPSFQLVMESDARQTINLFKYMVGCEGKLIEHKNEKKEITAIYYRVNRIDELQKLLRFFQIYNPRNTVKQKQLNLVNKLFELKKKNMLNDSDTIHNFINECYEVTELGKGKGKRKYNLIEVLEKAHNWLK